LHSDPQGIVLLFIVCIVIGLVLGGKMKEALSVIVLIVLVITVEILLGGM
jgi:diacylglycerol kinase